AGQSPRRLRAIQVLGRVTRDSAGLEKMTIEAADGGQMTCDALASEATRSEPVEVPSQIPRARLREGPMLLAQKLMEALEVSSVGHERIGGRPSFHLEGPEELGDRIHQTSEAGLALARNPRRMRKSIIRPRRKASVGGPAIRTTLEV